MIEHDSLFPFKIRIPREHDPLGLVGLLSFGSLSAWFCGSGKLQRCNIELKKDGRVSKSGAGWGINPIEAFYAALYDMSLERGDALRDV